MSNFLYWRNLWNIIMQIVIYKQFEKKMVPSSKTFIETSSHEK